MKVLPVTLPWSQTIKWRFPMPSDFHAEETMTDWGLMTRFRDRYKDDEYARILLGGDEVSGITKTDKRYDPLAISKRYREVSNPIDHVVNDLVELFTPLTGKILAGVRSNHNDKYERTAESSPHLRLANALKFSSLGYIGKVEISWRGTPYKTTFLVTHGKGGGARTIEAALRVVASIASSHPTCDVAAMGHVHKLGISHRGWLDHDGKNATKRPHIYHEQILIIQGCFKKIYSDTDWSPWEETQLFDPTSIGWPVVEVEHEKNGRPHLTAYTKRY